MNLKIAFLVIGVIVGAVVGWLTAPQKVLDVTVGNVSVTATEQNGAVTVGSNRGFIADPVSRTLVFAVIGGVVGLVIGFAADRRKAS